MTDIPLRLRLEQYTGYTLYTEPADRHNRYRFTIYRDEQQLGHGTHFTGTHRITPWIELQPAIQLDPERDTDRDLFAALTDVLEPSSYLMVHYLHDSETSSALNSAVPPPATPLGLLLWQAGVRWYKDWYFTEGWREGDQKLQGNLPLDETHKQEREQEWKKTLQQFVDSASEHQSCRKQAQKILETL